MHKIKVVLIKLYRTKIQTEKLNKQAQKLSVLQFSWALAATAYERGDHDFLMVNIL